MDDCIFCKIIAKTVPAEFVAESDTFVVTTDIAPKAPTHLLIISKEHIQSLEDIEDRHQRLLGAMLSEVKVLAKKCGLKHGYKVVINTGSDAGQTVQHLHIHLLGGAKLGGLV